MFDFFDAEDRHRQDADLLYASARWANADHLYGMAAECGLKCLMKIFGMMTRADGDPADRRDRVHVDATWQRYESYRSGHRYGAGYTLSGQSPFADWHVRQRYEHRGNFAQGQVDPHQRGAEEVRQLLNKAQRDGLI